MGEFGQQPFGKVMLKESINHGVPERLGAKKRLQVCLRGRLHLWREARLKNSRNYAACGGIGHDSNRLPHRMVTLSGVQVAPALVSSFTVVSKKRPADFHRALQ